MPRVAGTLAHLTGYLASHGTPSGTILP